MIRPVPLSHFDHRNPVSSPSRNRVQSASRCALLIMTQALTALLLACGGPPPQPAKSSGGPAERGLDQADQERDQSALPTSEEGGARNSGEGLQGSNGVDSDTSFRLLEPEKLDPTEANALIDRVEVQKSADGSFEIPVVHTLLTTAHYVEILRCRADYRFTLPDGRPMENLTLTNDSNAREQKKWAWHEAKGDPTFCRIVSLEAANSLTFDAAAQPGLYVYAINPCVQQIYVSGDRDDSCSYRISLSRAVEVKHGLASEARDRLQNYMAAESTTAGVLAQMRYNAEKIVRNRALCEKGMAVEQRSARLWNGLIELASFGISAAVSAAAPGLLVAIPGKALDISRLALSLFGKTAQEPPSCSALSQLFAEASALAEQLDGALADQSSAADELSGFLSQMTPPGG